MVRMVLLVAFSLSISAHAQNASVMSSEAVAAAFRALPKIPPTNAEVIRQQHYGVKVATLVHRIGPGEVHILEDRVFYVLSGSGSICTGGKLSAPRTVDPDERLGKSLEDCRAVPLGQGAVVSIPRGVAYQLRATSSTLNLLVVRIEGK